MKRLEDEGRKRENDHETKLEKMKQFYEEELKARQKSDTKEEDWLNERNKLTTQFQMQEKELSSKIRYLQGKYSLNEKMNIFSLIKSEITKDNWRMT